MLLQCSCMVWSPSEVLMVGRWSLSDFIKSFCNPPQGYSWQSTWQLSTFHAGFNESCCYEFVVVWKVPWSHLRLELNKAGNHLQAEDLYLARKEPSSPPAAVRMPQIHRLPRAGGTTVNIVAHLFTTPVQRISFLFLVCFRNRCYLVMA